MPPQPTTPRPLDTLWQAATIIWIILAGEALAVVLVLAPGGSPDWLAYFGMASFAIQWVFLTSLGTLYLCRRWLDRASPPVIAQAGLAALLLCTWFVCVMARLFLDGLGLTPAEGWFRFALQLTGLALTVGLLALAAFQAQWRGRQLALRAKQSELEALQARIRPHFLFNTLNTGAALVHARPDEAERLLLDLADLFRCALRGPQLIPLADELALTHRYLDIEALRFGERLRLEWHVPDTVPDVLVPSLSIQPLAENAIRHGIEQLPQGGLVDVWVLVTDTEVVVTVGNDLPGHAGGSGGHAVGFSSARERVDALTEGRGRVEARVEDGRHLARMVLPLG
ncbi:MAG: histidine kinase [Luteimonas sp.]|nr:histidine kinase [Luteimonas sp.]